MKNYIKYLCAVLMVLGMSINAWGATDTKTYDGADLSDWSGSHSGQYADGSLKLDAQGENAYNYSIWSGAISSGMTSITVTINYKINGSGSSSNVFTVAAVNSSGTVKASQTFAPTSTSYTDAEVTLTIPASSAVTGLKITYTTKSSGNVGVASLEAVATYTDATYNVYLMSGCTGNVAGSYSCNKGTSGSGTGAYSSCIKYSGITAGTSVTITATPADGYQFNGWTDGGYSIIFDDSSNEITPSSTTSTTATFTMPSSDVVIWECNFSESCISRTITVNTGTPRNYGSGTFTPTLSSAQSTSGTKSSWSSSNTSVATINSSTGLVTIVGAGSTTISVDVAASGDYCAATASGTLVVNAVAPTVTNFTASCTNNKITITNANASTVSNKGGKAITRYGYLYSTSVSTPTFGASGVSDANVGTTDVTKDVKWAAKDITGLSAGTTYYVRAYAYNGSVYGYSSVVTVTTKCAVTYAGNGGTGTVTDASSPYAKGSNVTVLANGFTAPDGKKFVDWLGSNSTHYAPGATISSISTDITLTAQWTDVTYSDYKFSCAELTLTAKLKTAGTPIFITSTANKTVRSQDTIHISGSGLTPSTTLTFPGLSSKFEIKKANGDPLATNSSGAIEEDAFIFYTPGEGDTSDGLDKLLGITVSVSGAKPKQVSLSQTIIGRHLPADFVIAAKNTNNNKWYALPANFSDEQTPAPIEISVDDINNPSVAYTANSNIYNLYGQNDGSGYLYKDGDSDGNPDGEKIKLGMKNNSNYPLFAFAGTKSSLKGDGTANVTNNINKQYWWTLTQTNTSIENPQDAKYTIASSNNAKTMSAWFNTTPQKWGLFAGGNGEHTLRLIPASSVVFTEAEIVAWGQHNAIVEVDRANAGGTDVAAAKVKAKLNGAESSLITLTETGTSKGSTTKYDYTVAFGDVIDFAANEGQMLTLEWYNSSDVMIAVSNIIVPRVIATTSTMYTISTNDPGWNTEVHVLPGVTLTADAGSFPSSDVSIKELNIYPGATVNVTSGTLKATTLVMRNGWDRLNGDKKYDVARLFITPTAGSLQAGTAYSDWYIDFDQYYPIAVPWEVDLSVNDGSKIWYKNTKSKAVIGTTTGSVRLRYYDGASRASNGQTNIGNSPNWKLYGADDSEAIPAKLQPGKGYAMTAKRPSGKAFSIIRMPLTIPSAAWTTGEEKGVLESTHKDQVTVSAYGDASTPSYAKGWNFIANPYMALYQGAITHSAGSGYDVQLVNIPDINFKEYDQRSIETVKLKPSSGFLIQTGHDGTLTFGTANRKAAAPSYRNEANASVTTKQKAYIVLDNENEEDMMGIFVSDIYTADYDINGDLEKLLSDGNTLRAWMNYINMNLAYVAVNEELAKEWIPVSVRIPATGEYTFSMHEASIADELEGVYLIDYQTGKITNLLYDSYTFNAVAGTDNARFAINAVIGKREVPTGVDISGSDKDKPTKFIWNDKVYILHNNVIYDSTGKRVNVIGK